MMEERTIELKIESAEDLKQVKWSGKMSPYAEAWVYRNHKVSTSACPQGGRNPRWNDKLNLVVSEHHLHDPKVFLVIDIIHHGALGRKTVGTVRVPLPELARNVKEPQRMSYQVRRPSGRPQGVLNFVVTVGEKREVPRAAMPQQQSSVPMQAKPGKQQEPVTAYPVGYPPAGQPYPQGMYQQQAYPQQPQYAPYPQQPQYAPYPQQPQYAPYPTAAPGGMYGFQQQRPAKRHGGMGMGLGAGLLGGLLLGEVFDNDGGGDFDGGFGDF